MDDAAPRRARSHAELAKLQARFIRQDELAASIAAYRPRPTDVVIAPAGKCGTT